MSGFWTTAELLRHGTSQRQIRRAVEQTVLREVRRGHFAGAGTIGEVERAVRVGGIATATTAGRALGLWTPPDPTPGAASPARTRPPDRLHVAVPRNAARLRDPDAARLPLSSRDHVVLHWTAGPTPPWTARTRIAPPPVLLQHAFLSLPPERALAMLDSAVHLRFLRPADLAALKAVLPPRLHPVVDASDRAESGIETITRYFLRRLGLRVEVLVPVDGLGTVDLLVEGRLIVELDGKEFHTEEEAFENDRRRDLVAATRRYRSLRFSWYRVLFRWDEVEAAVLAALSS